MMDDIQKQHIERAQEYLYKKKVERADKAIQRAKDSDVRFTAFVVGVLFCVCLYSFLMA